MSKSRRTKRSAFVITALAGFPLALINVGGCGNKAKPTVDAAPPDPTPAPTPTALVEQPVEDAGAPDADAGPIKKGGVGENPTVTKLKRCCGALKAEASKNATSPEGAAFMSAAATCTTLASQVGPGGNAPELAPLRAALAGRTIPDACRGL
jgi:hypothetical protein